MDYAGPSPSENEFPESERSWQEIERYLEIKRPQYRVYLAIAAVIRFLIVAAFIGVIGVVMRLHGSVLYVLISLLYLNAVLEVLAFRAQSRQIDPYYQYTRSY